MKCKSCSVAVSPQFAVAITDNRCPACGNRMMSDVSHRNVFNVVEQLGELGLDKKNLVGIAAAISSKYNLVPRDLALETDENGNIEEIDDEPPARPLGNGKPRPQSSQRLAQQTKPRRLNKLADDDDEGDEELTPLERQEIAREWGLEQGTRDATEASGGGGMNVMGALDPGLIQEIGSLDQIEDARHEDLLSRAQHAKNNPALDRMRAGPSRRVQP